MRNVILLLLSAIFRIRKACNFILQEKEFCPTFFDGILIFLRLCYSQRKIIPWKSLRSVPFMIFDFFLQFIHGIHP